MLFTQLSIFRVMWKCWKWTTQLKEELVTKYQQLCENLYQKATIKNYESRSTLGYNKLRKR